MTAILQITPNITIELKKDEYDIGYTPYNTMIRFGEHNIGYIRLFEMSLNALSSTPTYRFEITDPVEIGGSEGEITQKFIDELKIYGHEIKLLTYSGKEKSESTVSPFTREDLNKIRKQIEDHGLAITPHEVHIDNKGSITFEKPEEIEEKKDDSFSDIGKVAFALAGIAGLFAAKHVKQKNKVTKKAVQPAPESAHRKR